MVLKASIPLVLKAPPQISSKVSFCCPTTDIEVVNKSNTNCIDFFLLFICKKSLILVKIYDISIKKTDILKFNIFFIFLSVEL